MGVFWKNRKRILWRAKMIEWIAVGFIVVMTLQLIFINE